MWLISIVVLGCRLAATSLVGMIMSNTKKIILDMYNEQLFNTYKDENLNCLADSNIRIDDKTIYALYYEVIDGCQTKRDIDYHSLLSDILNCSKDLKYCIGSLFLFKPYINNPLEQVQRIGDLEQFPNLQNIYDRRYSIFLSIIAEKIYNYWDRIGDLFNAIFKVIDNERRVYFSVVIDNLPNEINESENFKWLLEFKGNGYSQVKDIRIKVVHYRQLETDYATRHLNILHDRKAVEELQAEKEHFPIFYKKQLVKTIEGFEKALKLIKEYSDIVNNNAN